MVLLLLATACTGGSTQGSGGGPTAHNSSGTTGDSADTAQTVDVPATVQAVLTRVAPTPAPAIDVQATVVAELALTFPPPTPLPSPGAFTPDSSLSDIVESLENGLVQIVTPNASGSGFAISNDGLIITNAHVVEEHEFVTVRSVSGWSFVGMVRGKDDDLDLAVVKIPSLGQVQAMPLGDASGIRTGDTVIAMGFPLSDQLGDGYTVTTGIVSSLRKVGSTERIQTDAAVNSGSSGGPLINSAGQVIGVNTTTFRDYEGISFAISIDEVKTHLAVLSAGQDPLFTGQDALAHDSAQFEDYDNEACHYSLQVPSAWKVISEDAGCRISLGRYNDDDRVGVVNVWEYPLNEGETLDDFSAWWNDSLAERAGNWNNFTRISSGKSTVERDGHQQDTFVIKYRWQETGNHCTSFATDTIAISNYQPIALVFSASLCDFMPPSVLEEIAAMNFEAWGPTPVSQPNPTP